MKKLNYFLMLIAFPLLFGNCTDKNIKHGFCHHVYFWLHNPDDSADRASFEKGIADLLKVPGIKSYHLGIPAETAVRDVVDGSYTYSYVVFFDDKAAHDVYQTHPIHLKFVADCQHLWDKVVVYDAISTN